MSANIDDTDEKIIHVLQADSRKAFVEIANEIGLSESAVRRRVKNLTRREIIKKFTVVINSGDKTSALTLISANSTSDPSLVSGRLMGLASVEVIYEITGQYDIAAVISAPSISQIN